MGWTCIKECEFIKKSHRRKNTRKTNKRQKKNWNVVWTDRKNYTEQTEEIIIQCLELVQEFQPSDSITSEKLK